MFDNFSTGHNVMLRPNVTYIRGDISKWNDFSQLRMLKIDYCVHLAAAISVVESMTNPEKYHAINVEGSRNVFSFCCENNVKAVVSASSAAIYGDRGRSAITENLGYGGISPYAKSKFEMEQLAADPRLKQS